MPVEPSALNPHRCARRLAVQPLLWPRLEPNATFSEGARITRASEGKTLVFGKHGSSSFFRFGALACIPGLSHAVVCRHGGVSRPPYDGLNVSHGVGDDPQAVDANRERLQQITGGIHVYTRQNHGSSIQEVDRSGLPPGAAIVTQPEAADALITASPGLRLLIQTADCQSVLLVDPHRRVAANVHCGWRGSVADIIAATVARMVAAFGCQPAHMLAAIGPSLGPCCAEFINYEREIPRPLWRFRVARHHFDFWQISRHQLMQAGLAANHVVGANKCTRCNQHLFFSYRAARQTGRFATLIGWQKEPKGRSS